MFYFPGVMINLEEPQQPVVTSADVVGAAGGESEAAVRCSLSVCVCVSVCVTVQIAVGVAAAAAAK